MDRDAQTSWSINVPARAALTQALLRNSTLCRCQLTYAFTRGDSGTEPVSTGRTPARIEDGVPLTFAEKLTLYNMITNESLAASTLAIPAVTYPLYLKLGDTATPIENLDPTRVEVELGHNISIGQPYGVETLYEWWSMKAINRTRDENNDGALPCPVERRGVFMATFVRTGVAEEGLVFIVINDKVAAAGGVATSLLSTGLVGFYTLIVLAIWRTLRGMSEQIVTDAM